MQTQTSSFFLVWLFQIPTGQNGFLFTFSFPFPLEVNALLLARVITYKHQVTVLGCRAKKDHLIRTEEERGLNEKVKKEQWVGKTTNKEIWKKLHIDQTAGDKSGIQTGKMQHKREVLELGFSPQSMQQTGKKGNENSLHNHNKSNTMEKEPWKGSDHCSLFQYATSSTALR